MGYLPFIELLSAPSILGLQPTGVELLAHSLLKNGLAERLGTDKPVVEIPTLNHLYSAERDLQTACLNPGLIMDFSQHLSKEIAARAGDNRFQVVLGGDCSILLGIMHGLKKQGEYGLVFIDAHADFYLPEQSTTGQLADMDLAMVTGRGPAMLTDIGGSKPYVRDENVIQIGQRDQEEAASYGSQDIADSGIHCFPLSRIREAGLSTVLRDVHQVLAPQKFWIHFDTDVLDDAINPAVEYRLPGGLSFEEAAAIISSLLQTGRAAGISVTIFNPQLDPSGQIASGIVKCLGAAFDRTL